MTSTPISKIPVQAGNVQQEEEDPEVLAILKEMQQPESVSVEKPMYIPSHHLPTPAPLPIVNVVTTTWYKQDLVNKAIIAALLAYLMFNSKLLEGIYTAVPALQKLQQFDYIIRILLLAVVFYLIMWKLNL
jgi:hypothetical protein